MKKKSIFTAVAPHVRQPALATIDIFNFYPSITQSVVYHLFLREFHCSSVVARIIAELTTHDGRLPQGSPVSLAIANLVMAPADLHILLKLSLVEGRVEYSRWVDDLIFSGKVSDVRCVFGIVEEAIRTLGLKINRRKSRLMLRHTRQSALGLVLNDGITIARLDRQKVRAAVKNWTTRREGKLDVVFGRIEFIRARHPRLAQQLSKQLSVRRPQLKRGNRVAL